MVRDATAPVNAHSWYADARGMLILQRALSLLCLGLIPSVGPLDVRTATPVALVASAAVLGCLVWLVIRARSRAGAIAVAILVVALAACAAALTGERGPLARGVFVVAPLAWSAIVVGLCAVAGERAPLLLRNPGKAAAVGAVVGVLFVAASIARFSSRAEMWRRIAERDPGNETAAIAVAKHRVAAGRPADARAVLSACVDANATNCACGGELAALGGDVKWIDGIAASCHDEPAIARARLDVMLARGDNAAVIRGADAILARSPDDGAALVARATAQWRSNDIDGALATARRATSGPRAIDARMLIGNILFAKRDLDGAANEFRAIIAADPNHAPSRYNLALVADVRDRYDDAREGYLAALRLDPSLANARYNLALLTHRHGATAEAKHHLAQLAKIAPDDPRIPRLRTLLDGP